MQSYYKMTHTLTKLCNYEERILINCTNIQITCVAQIGYTERKQEKKDNDLFIGCYCVSTSTEYKK